jgi:hypothetical protein
MNGVMHRFFEVCRAEPCFAEHPDQLDKIETVMELVYEMGDDDGEA